jgi:hypothetical protein
MSQRSRHTLNEAKKMATRVQVEEVAYVGAATSWYGLIPVAVLMSLGFGRIDVVLSSSGLLCLFIAAMFTVPPLGLLCGFAAHLAVRKGDVSPYPIAIALSLIADLCLVGWLFVL